QSSRINPTKTEKVRVVVCYLVIKAVKSLISISGGDALRGHTRSTLLETVRESRWLPDYKNNEFIENERIYF
ncbi:hypothetical protein, partial [Dorea formicigenerans]|uniref:hypothetical protein n=1 Tax=Dorea formicigenerans TaxID=39486 RepID=UPI001A9A2DCA